MQIKEGFRLRTVGNEQIVSGEGLGQIDFNKLISLNDSAAYLWQEVEGRSFDVETLAGLLQERYDLPAEQAREDAADIARRWIEVGIVEE